MQPEEKENLKDQLRAMAAGRGDGIDLDTPRHWVVEGIADAGRFFDCLPMILPSEANLYFEGASILPEVAMFYETHLAKNPVAVVRDSIFPIPSFYHVPGSAEVIAKVRELLAQHSRPQMFDHVKGYHGESLLFTFHDAFEGWLRISERVPEQAVIEFCGRLQVTPRKEETTKRDPEQLNRFLKLLEDPDAWKKMRIAGEPRWRTLLRRLGF